MKRIWFISLLLCLWPFAVPAEDAVTAFEPQRPLLVATKHAPPFVIKHEDGGWSGISIELWRSIADDLGIEYTLEESDLAGLLDGVATGRFDAAVAAVTVTAEREQRMDFSHPFYSSGLSIAVTAKAENAWLAVLKGFFTLEFVNVVVALLLLLLLIGILVWLFEHRRNQQFGGPPVNGIGSGLWWSAVTMTTVGYGDKSPITLGGRLVALVWMFASIIIISSFTAAIASALTVGQLVSGIEGPQDLYGSRTGTVAESSSETYLKSRHVSYRGFAQAQAGLQALADGEIEAFVYDQPLLQYLAQTEFQGKVQVLPKSFRRQDYAIVLPEASPMKEALDQALLKQLESPAWQKKLSRYLGLEGDI